MSQETTTPEQVTAEEKTSLRIAKFDEELKNAPVLADTELKTEDTLTKAKAKEFAAMLVGSNDGVPSKFIENVGTEEIRSIQTLSRSLQQPIKEMAALDTDANKISQSLIDLKVHVEEIDPGKFDFNPGWIGRMLAKVTGSSAINKYVTKYSSTQDVIKAVVHSLQEGKKSLEEDNIIFGEDKKKYREMTLVLREKIKILAETDKIIAEKIEEEQDPDRKYFLQEEIAFPLKQHIIDLEQTNVVSGQGVIALDILMKNNKELIRGVNRASNVTVTALTIGATIMLGLANQKKVLDKVKAVNETTDRILLATSETLKTQGVEIQKQASSATLNIENLKMALSNAIEAINEVETFKRNALPEMDKAISQLNSLSDTVETKILKMEEAEKIQITK